MKKIFILILLIFSINASAKEMSFEKVIDFFTGRAKLKSTQKVRIATDNITYGQSKIGTALSVYLETKLSELISNSKNFISLNRKDLERILRELQLSQSDLFDSKKTVKIGQLHGVQGLIVGEYVVASKDIILNLRLLSLKTSKVVATAKCRIAKTDLPTGLELYPVNYTVMKKNMVSLPQKGKLKVEIWTSRGQGGVYEAGEKLEVYFRANKSCYIRLFHIDVNGKKQMIFPNQFHPDHIKLKSRQIYVFPSNDMNFEFELGAPFGVEMIQVIASTDAFKNKYEAFEQLKGRAKKIFTRGLTIKKKKTEITHARVFFTIKKKL